jgi:hypothetical protein
MDILVVKDLGVGWKLNGYFNHKRFGFYLHWLANVDCKEGSCSGILLLMKTGNIVAVVAGSVEVAHLCPWRNALPFSQFNREFYRHVKKCVFKSV